MRFSQKDNGLLCRRQGELLRIEPWGRDALRIRATMNPDFTGEEWALTETPDNVRAEIVFGEESHREGDGTYKNYPCASITNGRIRATVNHGGVITLYKDGQQILRELFQNYGGSITRESHCLKVVNREWTPYIGGDYRLTVRFEPNDGEKLYGMGQYQQPYMELKGCTLELAQKNSQTTVPFLVWQWARCPLAKMSPSGSPSAAGTWITG